MNINFSQTLYPNNYTSFKSAYPVYHMVENDLGSYTPEYSDALIKKLQGKFVRILNRDGNNGKSKFLHIIEAFKKGDKAYAKHPIVRTFYALKPGHNWMEKKSYLITGEDVNIFNRKFCENLGRQKSYVVRYKGAPDYEYKNAMYEYLSKGGDFVRNLHHSKTDENGKFFAIYTKFKRVYGKDGKIADFKLESIEFDTDVSRG